MDRQQAFQHLKQPCIQLLQATASVGQTPRARTDLVQGLTKLLATLREIKPHSVDARLAEYIFVPISQVLRISRQVPVHGLELCLQCIRVLLTTGWKGGLEPILFGQLLILFTFLAKPSSTENGIAATSEELQVLAFQCMTELLVGNGCTQKSRQAITSTENVPALGEAVLVMLDSLATIPSYNIQHEAINALGALNSAIADDDALASFLPRIVSSLTKLLTPRSSSRPNFRIVNKCLNFLASILFRLLGDEHTKSLPELSPTAQSNQGSVVTRSLSWLHATSSQVKIALANIFRLREHDKPEVHEALFRLCLCVVQDCRKSLSDCTSMAIETMVSLVGREGSQDCVESKLRALLVEDPRLSDVLRESLHDWIISLPRLMQSKDDHGRRRIVQQVSVTLRLFDESPTYLAERLASSIRDGVSNIILDSKGLELLSENSFTVTDQSLVLSSTQYSEFPPLEFRYKGQDDSMKEFRLLIQEITRSDAALKMAQELITTISTGAQERRLASFWIALTVIEDMTAKIPSIDDFLDLGVPNLREEVLDNLYSNSLSILQGTAGTAGTEAPWQFYGLALEVVALQAKRYQSEFRPELSEVIYPILVHLGSSNAALRKHTMTCLNLVSRSSGYANARELVIENSDYIVNAVGLKLSIGDVSPQASQVLLMMMRLCGPTLLPYLDDLVGSIFDALERYHGYPKLAELLFSVLKGMAEEGVKAPQLALTTVSEHQKKDFTLTSVIESLKQLKATSQEKTAEEAQNHQVPFPEKPWKESLPRDVNNPNNLPDNDPTESSPPATQDDAPPPVPHTYTILLKICSLTQHHLTAPSPSLRSSLLSLLRTTIPALAHHENSFLPLIHTLWPVILPRLGDPEAYIVSNALDVVTLMCEFAGGFMRSRIEEAWDVLRRLYKRTQGGSETYYKRAGDKKGLALDFGVVVQGMKGLSVTTSSHSATTALRQMSMPELYVDTPTRMIRESFIGLLCSIARHVPVMEERGDEMLDMLDTVLERTDVKTAMECWNSDAVWLRLYRKQVLMNDREQRDDTHAEATGLLGKMPIGRPEWCFVEG